MPDGSNSPDAPITVYVDGDIKALPFIADLKRAGLRLVQEDGKTFLRKQEERDEPEEAERSTAPMDVVNDVACYIDQLLGIADLLTSVEREDLIDGTLARVGYAIEGILERARDRLGEAREVPHG